MIKCVGNMVLIQGGEADIVKEFQCICKSVYDDIFLEHEHDKHKAVDIMAKCIADSILLVAGKKEDLKNE